MYKPRRWSIMLANAALVVQLVAPVLVTPAHALAATASLVFISSPKYVRALNSGDLDAQVQVTNTATQVDFYLNGSTTPVASTTTVVAGAPAGYKWFRLYTSLPAGQYTVSAIATLSGDPTPLVSSNTGTVYSIDLPTAAYVAPTTANNVFRSSDNPVRLRVEDQFDQFNRVVFTVKDSSNATVGSYTVNRASCDLREAGDYLLCDINDSATWAPLSEGTYTVKATTYTQANNRLDNFAAPTSFTIDNTRPSVNSFDIDTPLAVYRLPIAVTAAASDTVGVASVSFYLTDPESRPAGPVCTGNGAHYQDYAVTTTGSDGKYHATFATAGLNGLYCINAQAADLGASHSLPIATQLVQIDTTAPATTLSSPVDDLLTRNPITISGQSTDNLAIASVQLEYSPAGANTWTTIDMMVNGTPGTPFDWTKTWTPPTDGSYDVRAITTDTAGNQDSGDMAVNVTYDTTPPNLTLTAPVPSYTNDSTPSITFTSTEAGTISWTGCAGPTAAFVGANTVDLNALVDGIYSSCQLQVTDAAGNISAALPLPTFTVDTVSPTNNFNSPTDNSYWHGPIPLNGTANDVVGLGQTVLAYATNPLGTWTDITTINESGWSSDNWSTTWTPASDGVYYVRALTYDLAGNIVSSLVNQVTYDTTSPLASIVTPTSNSFIAGAFTTSGFASDGLSGLSSLTLQFTGQPSISLNLGTEYDPISQQWQHTIQQTDLVDGIYDLTLTATDLAANNTSVTVTNLTIDNTPPTISVAGVASNSSITSSVAGKNHTVSVSLTASETLSVNPAVTIGGQPMALSTHTGNSYVYTRVIDGTETESNSSPIVISGFTDLAGNAGATVNSSFDLDFTRPVVALTNPSAGLVNGVIDVRGSVNDANPYRYYTVVKHSANTVVAGPGTVYSSSSFTDQTLFSLNTASLPDGVYTIELQARDLANSAASPIAKITVTVDNTAPVTTFSSPSSNVYVNHTLTIAGTSTDANGLANVTLYYSLAGQNNWQVISVLTPTGSPTSWDWTHDWTPPAEGSYDLKAAALDTVGNQEHSAYVNNVTYDVTSPTITNFQILKDGSPVTTLTPGENVTLRVNINDAYGVKTIGTVLENAATGKVLTNVTLTLISGTTYEASLTVPTTYLDGTPLGTDNRWAVGATDQAGNTSSKWSDFTIRLIATTTSTSTSGGSTGTTGGSGTSTGGTGTAVSGNTESTTELASPPAGTVGNEPTVNSNSNQEVAGASTERGSFWTSWWFWITIVILGGGAYYYVWWMRPEGDQS